MKVFLKVVLHGLPISMIPKCINQEKGVEVIR